MAEEKEFFKWEVNAEIFSAAIIYFFNRFDENKRNKLGKEALVCLII